MSMPKTYKAQKTEVLNALWAMLEDIQYNSKPKAPEVGICDNLWSDYLDWNEYSEDYQRLIQILNVGFIKWPGYSGNIKFPVTHPDFDDPDTAFWECDNYWEGEYGERRIDLLLFLIKTLTNSLER